MALREAVGTTLGDLAGPGGWRVERLFGPVGHEGDGMDRFFIVSTDPPQPVSPQQAFELAYRLRDAAGLPSVEPDLPVNAFQSPTDDADMADAAFAPAPFTPEDIRWGRASIRWDDAVALQPPAGGASRGEGIRVGHPDTGYGRHPAIGADLAALDLFRDHDFVDNHDDAEDPLHEPGRFSLLNPGHGTATSSVIAGRGTEEEGIVGVAPACTLVPLRAVNSVVQFFDSDVARAVDFARQVGCHVISMSLGGKGFFGLHAAIQRAVDDGLLVMAAAGNDVHIVTAPASYDNCIAVAAVNRDDAPWPGSSHGHKVEISAPGGDVYAASWVLADKPPTPFVSTHSGTSFAVAHLAGTAALWLAFHGRDALISTYGAGRLQDVFRFLLATAGHRAPGQGVWDSGQFGVGILDAAALLRAALPDPSDLPTPDSAFPAAPPSAIDRFSEAFPELSREALEARLEGLFQVGGAELEGRLDRFGGEVLYQLLADPVVRAKFVEQAPQPADAAFAAPEVPWATQIQARTSTPLAASIAGA